MRKQLNIHEMLLIARDVELTDIENVAPRYFKWVNWPERLRR